MAVFNRTEIQDLIAQYVDDPNHGYFTRTILNKFIANAERETQKMLVQAGEMYYLKAQQTLTVQNQWDYVLPADFLKIHKVELVLSGTGVNENRIVLQPITLVQANDLGVQSGTPVAYVVKKDRIQLFPTPDSTKTLRLYYSYRIEPMENDTDTPDVPEEYQELIAVLAAYDCFIKDDRTPSNLELKKQQYITMLKQAAEDRDESTSRSVVMLNNDSYGSGW